MKHLLFAHSRLVNKLNLDVLDNAHRLRAHYGMAW